METLIETEEKYNFNLRWLDELSKNCRNVYIKNNDDLVVAGDFNVLEHEKDVKDLNNWRLDALGKLTLRQSFRKLLSEGLANVVRVFEEPGIIILFGDYQKACWERNYGLRLIDHFLESPMVLQRTKNILFEKKILEILEKPVRPHP